MAQVYNTGLITAIGGEYITGADAMRACKEGLSHGGVRKVFGCMCMCMCICLY